MSSEPLPSNPGGSNDDPLGGRGSGSATQTKPMTPRKVNKRTCSMVGCKNGIVQGGVCVTHGAKRRKCHFPGCDKNAKCAGLCSKHGPPRKKCEAEDCNNVSVQAGKCKAHGAISKKCDIPGCTKLSVTGGHCKRHRDFVLPISEATNKQPGGDHDKSDFSNTGGFCVPISDNPGPNQEALRRAPAQIFSNFAMGMGPYAPGGLAAYAMAMNPMTYNPMMAAAMGMNLGYGYQMSGMHGNQQADVDDEDTTRQGGTDHSTNDPADEGSCQGTTDHSFDHPTEGGDDDVKVPAISNIDAEDVEI